MTLIFILFYFAMCYKSTLLFTKYKQITLFFLLMAKKRSKLIRVSDELHDFLTVKSKEYGVSVAACHTLILVNNCVQFKDYLNEREANTIWSSAENQGSAGSPKKRRKNVAS